MASVVMLYLYPKSDESTFDMDYYTSKHMPMLAEALGDSCKSWGVLGPPDTYHAVGWAKVESQDAYDAAMRERRAEIVDDVANYTNIFPEVVSAPVVV